MPSKKKSAKKNKSDPRADSRMGVLAQVMLELQTVWIFFTRLPWPGNLFLTSTKPLPKLAHATRAFPFAGVVVGAIGGLVLFIGAKSGLHPLAASILAIGASALVSGAIHEDGLADVADGFGGGSTKAKKLEIMKDSRVGTYGVMALIIATGLKAGLLAGFPGPGLAAGAFFIAHVLGRSGLGLLMLALAPARKSGLGKNAGVPKREDALVGALLGTLIAVLVLGPGPGLAASALAGLGLGGIGILAHYQIGGLTGDVIGAGEQVSEISVLLGLAIIMTGYF